MQLPCLVQLVQEGLSRERPVIGRVSQRERQSQRLGRKRGDGRERPGQCRLRKCGKGGRDEELQIGEAESSENGENVNTERDTLKHDGQPGWKAGKQKLVCSMSCPWFALSFPKC